MTKDASPADLVPNLAAISMGSNIHPVANLKAAVRELASFGCIQRVSKVWESPPAGFLDQANFLNAALLLETPLPAEELEQCVLKPIEQKLHRVRDPQNVNAPRTIDLDLSVLITPRESRVFDAQILARAFVAIPLAELLPDFVHPETGQTLAEVAAGFDGSSHGLILRPDCDLAAIISPRL